MKPQATKCTQKQLAYLAHWQALGYQFSHDERIPEDTCITPGGWDRPRAIELAVTAALLIAVAAWQYVKN